MISDCGWLEGADKIPSPNFNQRPEGEPISLLVIHNISLPPGEFGNDCIERFFTNQLSPDEHPYFQTIAELTVSAHLLIKRTGDLVQFVSFNDRAWHAGVSCFKGREQCNDFSIGIELEGTDDLPYTEAQYSVLNRVVQSLCHRYPLITRERMVGHCDIAPGRKTDPGPAFDWQRLQIQP